MRRRTLLVAGGTGAAALVASSLLPPQQPLLQRWLLEPFRHDGRLPAAIYAQIAQMTRVSFIGRALIEHEREQHLNRDSEAIEDWLIRRLAIEDPVSLDTGSFSTRLRSAIADDFRNNRLFDADDWQVSETEAQLAALRFHLHGGREPSGPLPLRLGVIAEVSNWGPQSTEQGVVVNEQSDGHLGLWFQASSAPSWLKLEVDGVLSSTQVFEDLVTSGMFDEVKDRILATPGRYELAFVDEMNRIRQPIGHFLVKPTPPRLIRDDGSRSLAFCAVTAWGPTPLSRSLPENVQPDGNIGLWFKSECAAAGTRVVVQDQALVTTVDYANGLVTALLPPKLLSSNHLLAVTFHDPDSDERLTIGTLTVTE